jgi:hypothetical protein
MWNLRCFAALVFLAFIQNVSAAPPSMLSYLGTVG